MADRDPNCKCIKIYLPCLLHHFNLLAPVMPIQMKMAPFPMHGFVLGIPGAAAASLENPKAIFLHLFF